MVWVGSELLRYPASMLLGLDLTDTEE
jgi:hypothetical protein